MMMEETEGAEGAEGMIMISSRPTKQCLSGLCGDKALVHYLIDQAC